MHTWITRPPYKPLPVLTPARAAGSGAAGQAEWLSATPFRREQGLEWYLAVLKKYSVFDGRSHRTEFWMFVLWSLVVGVVLGILDVVLGTDGQYIGLLGGLYNLAILVPSLAVGARRLHDIDRSGWWQLVGLIPLVGLIVLIVWWAQPGQAAVNQHGPDPWEGPRAA